MKLGILGGTFNPIHIAHLRIAEEVRDRLTLDQVLFIPAATPPHKPLAGELSFETRYEMVTLAIAGNPSFTATDMEGRRQGKSYSIDTLRALRAERPGDELYFIIGSDSYLDFGSWYKYEAIFDLCNIVVVERPGAAIADLLQALPATIAGSFRRQHDPGRLLHDSGHQVQYLPGIPLEISSSAIRDLAASGRSFTYLVPSAVEQYIKEKRIYEHAG